MIIAPDQLRAHLQDPDWIVFDCRHDLTSAEKGAQLYHQGHIRGAYFAPVDTALSGEKNGTNGRHPLPKPETFAAFLTNLGVKATTQIVAYDDVGGQFASRLWWMARWIGLIHVGVLDGGIQKWTSLGNPLSTETPSPRVGGGFTIRPNAMLKADADEIQAELKSGKYLILDARAPERFRGETEPIDKVAGHIPSAQNRFFKTNLNADFTLRPKAELRKEFETLLGHRKPADLVHQCGSGITACANLLAMEHAGLTGSRLYAGSWSEWISDSRRPIAKGSE